MSEESIVSPFLAFGVKAEALAEVIRHKQQRPPFPVLGVRRHAQLQTLSAQRMVWLNAPAGYGKTTVLAGLAHAHEQLSRPLIWLTLDPSDGNAEQFLLHLITVSEQQLGQSLQPALSHWHDTLRRGRVDTEQTLLLWLKGIEAQSDLRLCFDNVHSLGQGSSASLLIRLLELLPANVQIGLASRTLPTALGRLRLLPHLQWVDAKQLHFSDDEVQQLLQQHNIANASSLVPSLGHLLQGWPAGLNIWLARYQAVRPSAELTTAQVRQLALLELGDYLTGEVLQALPPPLVEFLRFCAVLGSFNEAVLQHCYGNDDYHALLLAAQQQNLFIIALAQPQGWFKIHPVMAQLLASQLPYAQRQRLHQAAFTLLSQTTQHAVVALRHALAADMAEQVQDWLMQEAEQVLANLDFASLLEWFDQLGDQLVQRQPRLLAIHCWVLLLAQQGELAQQKLALLQQFNHLQPFERDALEGYLARLNGDLDRAELLCHRAFSTLPTERFTLRIFMASTLAQLRLAQQDMAGARAFNQLTQKIASQHQAPALEALSWYDAARLSFYSGQINASKLAVERGLQLLNTQDDYTERLPRGRLLTYQSILLWLTTDQSPSLQDALHQGVALCLEQHDVSICYGYVLQALMLSADHQPEQALHKLDSLAWLLQRWQVEANSYHWLVLVRVNVLLNHGKLAQAQQQLDGFLAGRNINQLPRSEVFPMLPGLVRITQARLLLLSGQLDQCLTFIEKSMQQGGGSLYRALLELLRALALRNQNMKSGQSALSVAVRNLQREHISTSLLYWLTALHEPVAKPHETASPSLNAHLSERELEVLKKIALGLSNQEIADQLFVSLHTVKTHARKINVKLAAKSRTQALARAQELGLI